MPPKKPAPKGKSKAQPTGFMNWLGRQVGHVKSAVDTDVTKPAAKAKARGQTKAKPRAAQAAQPQPQASPPPPSKVIYRDDKIEQVEHPTQPGVILRRTIIDEVIVEEEREQTKGDR
jgi:hypothetical protein